MAQLDSGDGGDASGGLDGPDSQTEIEDDTGDAQERQLRRDAQSDPMEDQTEPVDRGSAGETTARPAQGSGGSGASVGGSAGASTGEQTAEAPQDGPQPSSGTPGPSDGQQGGPMTGQTTVDAGGPDDPQVTTGTPGDVGVPPSDFQAPPNEPAGSESQADPIVVAPDEDPQQVVEQEVEQQLEEQTGRDVTPGEEFEVVRENGEFRVELSGPFVASLSREAAREAGVDMGERAEQAEVRADLAGDGTAIESGGIEVSTDYFDLQADEAVPHRGSINVEAVEQLGEQREAAREQAEQTASARLSGAMSASSALGRQAEEQAEQEQFGDIDWSGLLGIDSSPTDLTDQEISERDLRQAGIDPATVLRPAGDPDVDEVEVALSDASAVISGAGRDFSGALFDEGGVASESLGEEILVAGGREDLGRGYEETLRGFGKGLAQAPFAIGNVPAVGGAVLEGVEFAGYAATTDPEQSIPQTRVRAEQIADVVVQEVRERPAEFGGLAVGTLGASYGIMRAAASVGPRTGLAARYAIQPGEELAGSTGFRVTRRVAGERRAQQLFPNREPLIFSEEFAIRQARRLREGAGPRASAARARATDLVLGEPETRINYDPTRYDPIQRTTARPGVRSQAGRAADRVVDAFSGRTYAGIPIPRATARSETDVTTGAEVSTRAETQSLMDDLEGPLKRMEESRRRQAERADPIGETAGRPTEYRVSPSEPELSPLYRSELATEAETGARTRLELAQQQSTEPLAAQDVQTDILGAQDIRGDLTQEIGLDQELVQEVDQEIDQETDLELFQELAVDVEQHLLLDTEFEFETETETEFELELETETEVEAEQFDLRDERRDDDEIGILGSGTSRLVERDLLNPFTGR